MDKERQIYQQNKENNDKLVKAIQEKKPFTLNINGGAVKSVEIKGPKGESGTPGKDGSTPIKGVDYFTMEEQSEIVEKILKTIKVPKDGSNGKDAVVDYAKIQDFVKREVSKIPKPKNGVDGVSPVIDYDSIIKEVTKNIPEIDYKTIYENIGKEVERIERSRPRQLQSAGPSMHLADINDVDVQGITPGQVLSWNGTNWVATTVSGGGGAVDSVNGQTGDVVLDTDDIADTATNRYTNDTDIAKLAGIEAGAEVNNISDVNATDLTDGGDTTLHIHDSRYYTESEVDTLLGTKVTANGAITGATKTKITYDAKGLVTAGADATTADIADSTDKRYVTDADLTNLDGVTSNIQTQLDVVSITNEKLIAQTFPNAIAGNIGSGNIDIYTCPSSKRAIVNLISLLNTAGTTTTYYMQLKVSGVYYRISTNATLASGSDSSIQSYSLILEPGESLAINTSQAGLNVFPTIIEFPDTAKSKTIKNLSISSGDNTIYTVPSGKTAILLTAPTFRNSIGNVHYVNTSGSTATFSMHISSSTTSASTNRFRGSTLATITYTAQSIGVPIPSTYSVVLNTNQTGGHAWVSVIEI